MMSRREGAGLISEPDAEEDAMLVGLYLVRLDVKDICLDGAIDFGVTVICLRANAVLLIMKSDDVRRYFDEQRRERGSSQNRQSVIKAQSPRRSQLSRTVHPGFIRTSILSRRSMPNSATVQATVTLVD